MNNLYTNYKKSFNSQNNFLSYFDVNTKEKWKFLEYEIDNLSEIFTMS